LKSVCLVLQCIFFVSTSAAIFVCSLINLSFYFNQYLHSYYPSFIYPNKTQKFPSNTHSLSERHVSFSSVRVLTGGVPRRRSFCPYVHFPHLRQQRHSCFPFSSIYLKMSKRKTKKKLLNK
jgi:hypothetical protein